MKIAINKNNENKIRYALPELRKGIHSDMMHLAVCESILCSMISIEGLHEYEKKRSILLEAVTKVDINQYTLDDLKNAIKSTVTERRARKLCSFKIIFFLHIDTVKSKKLFPFFQKKWVILNNQKLYFRRKSYFDKYYESKIFFDKCKTYERHLPIKLPLNFNLFQIVEMRVKSPSYMDASFIANDVFNLLRGVLNYCNNCFSFNQQFGIKSPLNKFLPSPLIGIFDDKGKFLAFDYQDELYKYKDATIARGFQDKTFFRLIKDLKSIPESKNVEEINQSPCGKTAGYVRSFLPKA